MVQLLPLTAISLNKKRKIIHLLIMKPFNPRTHLSVRCLLLKNIIISATCVLLNLCGKHQQYREVRDRMIEVETQLRRGKVRRGAAVQGRGSIPTPPTQTHTHTQVQGRRRRRRASYLEIFRGIQSPSVCTDTHRSAMDHGANIPRKSEKNPNKRTRFKMYHWSLI